MHVLLNHRGRLALRRLWPWQQILADGQAARLDRALADGTSPEASVGLAARAARLTSTEFRRDLAASLRRILLMADPAGLPTSRPLLGAARTLHVPICPAQISQSAPVLADLANRLLEPGPVPVRGVAMVTELLADGTGPLYRDADPHTTDDLTALATRAADALTW